MISLSLASTKALALDSQGNGPTRSAATALYVFNPANIDRVSWTIPDLAPNPLNLQILNSNTAFLRFGADYIEINNNLIRSMTSADKIVSACKASNEMTVEMWLQPNSPSEKLVNNEDEEMMPPGYFKQSIRLLSLADIGFKEFHNMGLFQAYNSGDAFKGTVRTSVNSPGNLNYSSPDLGNLSGDFVNPLLSSKNNFLMGQKQHVIFTRSAGGIAKLYTSDSNGVDSLAVQATTGFGGDFKNWHSSGQAISFDSKDDSAGLVTRNLDMRLGIGNEPSSPPDFGKPTAGGEGPSKQTRNWPFNGRLYMVAIYCKALTKEEILGAAAPQSQVPPLFEINLSKGVTAAHLKAQTMFTRLTGVKTPIDNPLVEQMANLLTNGQSLEAADLVTKDTASGSNFYNITVRDMAVKMSTREGGVGAPLNDFTATVIGATRDGLDARTLLTDNLVYHADPRLAAVPSDLMLHRITSNAHYESLDTGNFDLAKVLVRGTQKISNGSQAVDNPDPAGLLTSRAWMSAHAVAGTNRRPIEFAFQEFLCTPMTEWANNNGSDAFIGRDIDRFPGGSHAKFTQNCRSCHTQMDPMRGAYAYFTFSNSMVKNTFVVDRLAFGDPKEDELPGAIAGLRANDPARTTAGLDLKNINYVVAKMNHNDNVFPGGRLIVDNSFHNPAAVDEWGKKYFGWRGATTGSGVKAFGSMIANSEQFSRCMAQRIFASVCKRPVQEFDSTLIRTVAGEFETNGYKLDYLFKRLVGTPECLGEGGL